MCSVNVYLYVLAYTIVLYMSSIHSVSYILDNKYVYAIYLWYRKFTHHVQFVKLQIIFIYEMIRSLKCWFQVKRKGGREFGWADTKISQRLWWHDNPHLHIIYYYYATFYNFLFTQKMLIHITRLHICL